MVFNSVVASGVGEAFTGTASITYNGTRAQNTMSYMNDSMELVQVDSLFGTPPDSIPIPQIIYAAMPGMNESMSVSGDCTVIASPSYPTAKVLYVYGDITISSS